MASQGAAALPPNVVMLIKRRSDSNAPDAAADLLLCNAIVCALDCWDSPFRLAHAL